MRFNGLSEDEKQLLIVSLEARKNSAYRVLGERNVEQWRVKSIKEEIRILDDLKTEILASK
jgi:hypothetical protein